MKKERNMFQTKEEDKSLKANLNETEISDLCNREFKIIVIRFYLWSRA